MYLCQPPQDSQTRIHRAPPLKVLIVFQAYFSKPRHLFLRITLLPPQVDQM